MVRGRRKIRQDFLRQPKVYYQARSREAKNPRLTFQAFKYIFLSLLLIFILYLIFLSPVFRVKDVLVEGNDLVSSQTVANEVATNSNLLLLSNRKLKNKIIKDIPEVKEVEIYKGLPNAIKIVVLEYDKSLVWKTGDRYYLISSQGVVYKDVTDKIADFSSLPRVEDSKNVGVSERQKIVSPNFVAFAENVYNNLFPTTNIEPDHFYVGETTIDLMLVTKANFYIKFDTLRSSKKQLADLKSVLVAKRAEIAEYVDMRIDGWAYYK